MPKHWITFPSGSAEELRGYEDNPHGFEQRVANIVAGKGGEFDALWYGLGEARGSAYVLVDTSEDKAKAIAEELQSTAIVHLESVPERHRSLRLAPPSAD